MTPRVPAPAIAMILTLPLAVGGWAFAGTAYESFPELRGAYFGAAPPGDSARVFAGGVLKPPRGFHSAVVFNHAGDEAWWTAMASGETYHSRLSGGTWTPPRLLPFDREYGVREPMPSADGRRLYFLSRRPLPDDPVERERIWYVERDTGGGWSPARVVDEVVAAHPTHWQFSFTEAGDLYFMSEIARDEVGQDIYCAPRAGDGFAAPFGVGPGVNTEANEFCPFVAPDGSYLIFARSPASWGRSDLFISFRTPGGAWASALDMGGNLRSRHNETSPVVTRDGRYLFFLRVSSDENNVWWVGAGVIDELRPR